MEIMTHCPSFLAVTNTWSTPQNEQSSLSHKLGGCFQMEEEEEVEDLSMISDASSWPPHLDGTGYCCIFSAPVPSDGGKKGRAAAEQQHKQHAVLEDTASSQLFRNTNKNNFSDYDHQSKKPMEELLDSSCGLSTTQSKAKSSQPQQNHHRDRGNKLRRKEDVMIDE